MVGADMAVSPSFLIEEVLQEVLLKLRLVGQADLVHTGRSGSEGGSRRAPLLTGHLDDGPSRRA